MCEALFCSVKSKDGSASGNKKQDTSDGRNAKHKLQEATPDMKCDASSSKGDTDRKKGAIKDKKQDPSRATGSAKSKQVLGKSKEHMQSSKDANSNIESGETGTPKSPSGHQLEAAPEEPTAATDVAAMLGSEVQTQLNIQLSVLAFKFEFKFQFSIIRCQRPQKFN